MTLYRYLLYFVESLVTASICGQLFFLSTGYQQLSIKLVF